jgi:twitching motility protein PilT
MMLNAQRKQQPRIGEILVNYGLISYEQLTRALDRQVQTGSRLGSILEEMGYLDINTLLNVLSNQYGLPFVNLFEVNVPPETLKLLPFDQVKSLNVLPFRKSDNTVSVAMVNPEDVSALQNVESAVGGNIKPYVVPHYQMDKAISCFEKDGYGDSPFNGEKLREDKVPVETAVPNINTLFKLLHDFKATDLHLAAGAPPGMRINDELKRLSMPKITSAQMKDFIAEILTKDQIETFEKERELDFVISLTDTGRFRMNIYKQRNSVSLSARLIYEKMPSSVDLGLPDWIADYALRPHGFVLIGGLAGHGKTTTVAALVDIINSRRSCNIVTLEDPIEYLHKHKKSNVNQREVGIDTDSFSAGLTHILRQDPDVIVVSDLRDTESIAFALNAAENGHLVIATMHSLNSVTSIDKILNIFPAHQQPLIRTQLADTLLMLFSQKLIPGKDGEGKILAYEKLINSSRVANLIREGKTANIRSLMQIAADDVLAMDQRIAQLCFEGMISFEDGLRFADTPAYYQELIRSGKF